MTGYIKEYRDLLNHWVSSDSEAFHFWGIIKLTASFKKHKRLFRGKLVELDAGELLFSRPQWATRYNISESKLTRLLELFKSDGMIDVTTYGRQYTRIRVINWQVYQSLGEVYPLETIEQENEQGQSVEIQGIEAVSKKGNEQRTNNGRTSIMKEGNKGKKNSSSKVFAEDSLEMKLSVLLKSLILQNHPNAKLPNGNGLQKWAAEFDLMLRIDKRTEEEIRHVIEFSQNDSFWSTNILSSSKLRKQFDTLLLQSRRKGKQPAPQNVSKVGNVIVADDSFRRANGY